MLLSFLPPARFFWSTVLLPHALLLASARVHPLCAHPARGGTIKGSNQYNVLFGLTECAKGEMILGMPRKLRVEYRGAIYHVMSRGDRHEDIFLNDVDRQDFLTTLAEACQKTGCFCREQGGGASWPQPRCG